MTPTRSSRRYLYLRGRGFHTEHFDKPTIPMAPAANQAVASYPLSTLGTPPAFDLVQRLHNSPDQGTALPR